MSKHYYIIVDTETTKKQTVADFGAVVVDRSGAVHERLGCMVTVISANSICSLIPRLRVIRYGRHNLPSVEQRIISP